LAAAAAVAEVMKERGTGKVKEENKFLWLNSFQQ
jgi:hypothetical protein